jgi:alpha-beta hydrolase superfamily lysophospholipase
MGSAISLRYVLKHQSELAGWICSGTTLFLDKSVAQPIVVAASAMARVLPKFRLVPFSSKHLSRDPDVVAAYDTDPLVDHKPLRLQILKGMIRSCQQARPQLETIKLPVLILHGTADKVVPVAGSQYLYEHIGSQDKTLKLYEGLFHEIHNEPEQKMVLDDVVQWLNRQRPAKLKVIRRNP